MLFKYVEFGGPSKKKKKNQALDRDNTLANHSHTLKNNGHFAQDHYLSSLFNVNA